MLPSPGSNALARFILLFAVMYAAFGVASPFLPQFLQTRGLRAEEIGILLAAGTGVRLLAGPAAGHIADRLAALRPVLSLCAAGAAMAALSYLPASGLWPLLLVSLLHAAALAPTTTLADALALASSVRPRQGFEYGWVRGSGSAAFIFGSILAGQAIGALGLAAILWLQAGLLAAAACCALLVPDAASRPLPVADRQPASSAAVRVLVALPSFRRLVLIA
ncbi:MAG: MFS transporter, partial [Xanthobacteraceae bacterium]